VGEFEKVGGGGGIVNPFVRRLGGEELSAPRNIKQSTVACALGFFGFHGLGQLCKSTEDKKIF